MGLSINNIIKKADDCGISISLCEEWAFNAKKMSRKRVNRTINEINNVLSRANDFVYSFDKQDIIRSCFEANSIRSNELVDDCVINNSDEYNMGRIPWSWYVGQLKTFHLLFVRIQIENEHNINLMQSDFICGISFPVHAFSINKSLMYNHRKNYCCSFAEWVVLQNLAKPHNIAAVFMPDEHKKEFSYQKIKHNLHDFIRIKKAGYFIDQRSVVGILEIIKALFKFIRMRLRLPHMLVMLRMLCESLFLEKIDACLKTSGVKSVRYVACRFHGYGLQSREVSAYSYRYSLNECFPPIPSTILEMWDPTEGNSFPDGCCESLLSIPYLSVGLTSNSVFVQKFYSKYFNVTAVASYPDDFREPKLPSLVGYSSICAEASDNKLFTKEKKLLIFDMPPVENNYKNVYPSIVDTLQFNEIFLEEILSAGCEKEYVCYLKPKYSIKNYIENYKKLINKYEKKYNLKILNPYVSMRESIEDSSVVISAPYTTSYFFAARQGIASFYYIPGICGSMVGSMDCIDNIIVGNHNLINTLGKLSYYNQKQI